MTGLRCTSSSRRAGRGGSTTVLRPARAQPSSLGLSSTGPNSLPPSPATVLSPQSPRADPAPRTLEGEGVPSLKFSRLASLSSRLPGRASQRVPAVTTFLARAQEQQPRSPAAGTRGRETREGFPAGAAPGWAGRDRAAWLHKHDGAELHTQLRARGCGPGEGGLRRPTHPLLPPRRPQKLAAGGPACAELQPPPARSPGVPSLAAPPAGLGRRPSNTTYPAPARPPASAVALPSAAGHRLWVASEEPSRLHALPDFLKTNRRRRFPRAVPGASAKPAPPEAWKFAGRARAGRACCHPLLATRQPRRAPRPYSLPGERSPLPACHPQSCDAVSGLHGSDSSVELTA